MRLELYTVAAHSLTTGHTQANCSRRATQKERAVSNALEEHRDVGRRDTADRLHHLERRGIGLVRFTHDFGCDGDCRATALDGFLKPDETCGSARQTKREIHGVSLTRRMVFPKDM